MTEIFQNMGTGASEVSIKVIGVGGAGTNTVDRMQLDAANDIALATINTDAQALDSSPAAERHLLGAKMTRGLGAGGDASIGRRAAESEREALAKMVGGQDLVIVVAGLGGGTGSGAAPVIAQEAVKSGATVVAFVTLPFSFEGKLRKEQAEEALQTIRSYAHAVIPLPNDILMQQLESDASVMQAFALADSWIGRGIYALTGLIRKTGLINVDFATLRRAFPAEGGKTLFGLGEASGGNAMKYALEDLCLCPLLHLPEFAKRVDTLVVNITGGPSLSLAQVNQAMNTIGDKFGGRDDTIMGAVVDEDLGDTIRICILGTTDVGTKLVAKQVTPTSRFDETGSSTDSEFLIASDREPTQPRTVHQSKLGNKNKANMRGKKGRLLDEAQEMFSFSDENNNRGAFDTSERNLYDGEDLDVPTFLRRGLKVAL